MRKTEDMKIKFLGVIPWYKNENLELSPQEVAAFSGLLTFRGDSVEDLIMEAQEKGQDISKKVKFILRKSSLKGHASMATMPVFCFTFEGTIPEFLGQKDFNMTDCPGGCGLWGVTCAPATWEPKCYGAT